MTADTGPETTKLRANFQDFVTCLATYSPPGFSETISRESTSFNWAIDLIKTTYGLDTKGEHFLALDDLKFEFDSNYTYQQAYMEVKDFICAGLLKKDSMFEGKRVPMKETLSPATKNFITKEWLSKIDPRLPKHVRDTRGHLFTSDRPSLACNQKILCDQMTTMMAELDGKSDTQQGNVSMGYVPAMGGSRPRGRFEVRNNVGRGVMRGAGAFRGRPPPPPRKWLLQMPRSHPQTL